MGKKKIKPAGEKLEVKGRGEVLDRLRKARVSTGGEGGEGGEGRGGGKGKICIKFVIFLGLLKSFRPLVGQGWRIGTRMRSIV